MPLRHAILRSRGEVTVPLVAGSMWCRGLAILAWLLSLLVFYIGYVASWGLALVAMAWWSSAALPMAWLTVRWLRRLGAPLTSRERTLILWPWVSLLLIQVPVFLAPDNPAWDGREWLLIVPDFACKIFPFAVVVWAILRALLTPSPTNGVP